MRTPRSRLKGGVEGGVKMLSRPYRRSRLKEEEVRILLGPYKTTKLKKEGEGGRENAP